MSHHTLQYLLPLSRCNKRTDLLFYCDVGNQEENSEKQFSCSQTASGNTTQTLLPCSNHYKITFGLLDSLIWSSVCDMTLLLIFSGGFLTRGGVRAPGLHRELSRKAEILLSWKQRRLLLWHCETPRSSQLCSGPCSHFHPPSPPARPCLQTSALLCASCGTAMVVVSSVQQDWLVSGCFSSFFSSSFLWVFTYNCTVFTHLTCFHSKR